MREAIGGNFLFQIVIMFLLLFTGVMCITINHSKAFGVKDKIINIIESNSLSYAENYQLNEEVIGEITDYITESGYRTTNECPSDYVGYRRDGSETTGRDASLCVKAVTVSDSYSTDVGNKCYDRSKCAYLYDDLPSMVYYDILLFYQIDAPILDDVFNLNVKGSTKIIYG